MIEDLRMRIAALGWSETARRSGVDRVTLHRCFGPTGKRPNLHTLEAVLGVFGLELTIREIVR